MTEESWPRKFLPAGMTAGGAIGAVLCVLAQRFTGGEARHLAENLPIVIRPLVRPCAYHAEQPREFQPG